jgi:FMN-dependent dehydrogenase
MVLSPPECRKILGVSNLLQIDERARTSGKLTRMAFDYYAAGSDNEETLHDNRAAFSRFALLPRMLKGVRGADTSIELLGALRADHSSALCAFKRRSNTSTETSHPRSRPLPDMQEACLIND